MNRLDIKNIFTDLFPDDLDPNDPNLQTNISGLREFLELTAPEVIKLMPGTPTSYQKVAQRLMDITNAILLFWEPGAGKTGAIGEISEEFRRRALADQVDGTMPSPINGAIVIAPNNIIIYEVKKLLFCNHTQGFYNSKKIESTISQRQQRRAITEAMNKWYLFATYGTFLGALQNEERNPARAKIIDENGDVIDGQERNFQLVCDNKVYFFDEIHHLQQSDPSMPLSTRKDVEFRLINHIRRLCKNAKIVLLSGTPAVKEVEEFRNIISILYGKPVPKSYIINVDDKEREVEFKDLFQPSVPVEVMVKTLEKYVRGHISYMVSPSTGVEVEYKGTELDADYGGGVKSKLILWASEMSVVQTYFYLLMRKSRKDVAFKSQTEASNFIYPPRKIPVAAPAGTEAPELWNEVVGDKAYAEYIQDETSKNKKTVKNVWSSPDKGSHQGLVSIFRAGLDPNLPEDRAQIILNIEQFSAKFASILRLIEFDPATLKQLNDESNIKVTPGCIYIFFVSVENGIAPFSMALEALGYSRYKNNESAFLSTGEVLATPCDIGKSTEKRLRPDIKKWVSGEKHGRINAPDSGPLRYGVITSKTDNSVNQSLKELFNSAENVRGEYCRIMMVSQVGRAGINVFNCQQGHVEEGWWDPGIVIQAEKRFLRLDGFDTLKQIYPGNIQIPIYRHIALPMSLENLAIQEQEYQELFEAEENKETKEKYAQQLRWINEIRKMLDPNALPEPRPLIIDQYIYEQAEQRQFQIRRGELLLKICAMDAWINRPAILTRINADAKNATLSAESPYYEPYKPPATNMNEADYYLRYGQEDIKQAQVHMLTYLNTNCYVNVYNLLKNAYSTKVIARAVDQLINYDKPFDPDNKISLHVKGTYYYPASIDIDHNSLYLSPLLAAHDGTLEFYRHNLVATEQNNLVTIISRMSIQFDDLFQYIMSRTTVEQVRDQMTKLNEAQRAQIIEAIILRQLDKGDPAAQVTQISKIILSAYRHFIFEIPRPTEIINKLLRSRSGERNAIGSSVDIQAVFEKLEQAGSKDKVILHTLYWLAERRVHYSESSQYKSPISTKGDKSAKYIVRILDRVGTTNGEAVWNDLVPPLTQVYGPILDIVIDRVSNRYRLPGGLPVRGTALPNGALKLLGITSDTGRNVVDLSIPHLQKLIKEIYPDPQIRASIEINIRGTNEKLHQKNYAEYIYNLLKLNGAIFWMVDWGEYNITPKLYKKQ